MTEKTKTVYKPLFFWMLFISIVVIVVMGVFIKVGLNDIDYYESNYEYSCDIGEEKRCITAGNHYKEYSDGERVIIIQEDEDYAICDTDRKEKAICVDEDASRAECDRDERAICVNDKYDWTECSSGEDAKCIKEDRAATISERGTVSYCNIGEFPTCN